MMSLTLVLLPGLDGTGLLFERFIAALPDDVEPVVIGYPEDRILSYAELVDFVRSRLPDRPYALLGESFSGPIAVEIAATDDRVQALVLCASFVTNPAWFIPRAAAFFVVPMAVRCIPAWIRSRLLLGRHATPPLVSDLERALRGVTPAVVAARVKAILAVESGSELRRCSVPVLYVAGSEDRLVRPRSRELIRETKPDLEVVEISAPHLVLQVAPAEAAAAIVEFVTRATSAKPAVAGGTHRDNPDAR